MQGRKYHESKLFYTVELNRLVPDDRPVRRICEVLDLRFLYRETRQYYSHEGKPSIDPVVLFKIHLIGYLFGVFSERQLFREIQVNMAYRWYLGYDLDEEISHHSIMTKSRHRFPVRVFEAIFKRITALCRDKGLISGTTTSSIPLSYVRIPRRIHFVRSSCWKTGISNSLTAIFHKD